MRPLLVLLAALWGAVLGAADCPPGNKSNSKLFCYFGKLGDFEDTCRCSFVVLRADADVKAVETARGAKGGARVLVTVNEFSQGLVDILKTSKVDGLEIDLKKLDSKSDIVDFISTVRSKLGADLYLALAVPPRAETLAKYYDFKRLSKHVDAFILQTSFLGASKNVTFHPSRLSGLWDTQNTDSLVDLVNGLGAPLSKVVISAPVQAFHFTLQDEKYSAPGSPAVELKSITRRELCEEMRKDSNWTLERDQDQAGPYIFSGKDWIAFEDSSSIDVKAKYARVRGLAGMALKDLSQDDGGKGCGPSVLEAAHEGLSRQARAPRGAVLHSLERELQGDASGALTAGVRVSPYRISRVIDVEGHIHVVRQDTRTEFTCSRQGFFAHPRSCNRFYRCVLFDQTGDEFSVFEFDCPAGLAFDERVEVCVWPGSLPEGRPCRGSSEIAPVPRSRFVCPQQPGYYADPENCRWFFACLDHGNSPLSAYEFRCPFGLVFDSDRLMCEWPWLVPRCSSSNGLGISLGQEYVYGHASANALDQYNGLGSLGVVKLGGLSGQIQQPIVYSNVGGASLGGLGIKATQSLVSAGLLRGTNIYDNNVQYSSGADTSGSFLGGASADQQSFGAFGLGGRGSGSYSYNSNSDLGSSILNLQSGAGSSRNNAGSGSYSYNSNSGLDSSSLIQQSGSGSSQNVGGSGSHSYNSISGLDSLSLNEPSGSGSSQNNAGSESYSYNSNSGLDSSSLNQQSGYGSSQHVGESGSYSYNSNSGLDSLSLNKQSGSGSSENNAGSESYSYNSNSGLDSSSLNQQSGYGSSQHVGGSGSYSYNSNSGLDSLSLNKQSGSGSSENNAGSGSYSYNSNSGLDSSSLNQQSGYGSSQHVGGSGSYSYNSNSGLDSLSLNKQSGSGSSENNAGSGSYSYNSNSGLDSSSLNQHSGYGSSQHAGSYSYNSNSGLDSLSLNKQSDSGSSQQNEASGSSSYLSNAGSGLSQSGSFHDSASGGYISDTVLALGGTNSFGAKIRNSLLNSGVVSVADSGSSQYQGFNDGGSGSYFVNSNLGHDASSLDSKTTQQQLNKGSYHGIIKSGSSQYQGSSIGGSGSISANSNLGLDASSSSGTKATQQVFEENGGDSNRIVHFGSSQYQGSSNDGSESYVVNSGVDTSGLFGTQLSEENENKRIVHFGSSQYQGSSNGATALDSSSLFGTKIAQQHSNGNIDGSYNGIKQSGSSQYQGSSNDGSANYIVSSNTGKDASSSSGIISSHLHLDTDNRGYQNGGSSSYSYSYSGQGGAAGFGTKSSQDRLNIKSTASGAYNSLDGQVGNGIGIQVGYNGDSRTDNLGLVHGQEQLIGNGVGLYSEQSSDQNQQDFSINNQIHSIQQNFENDLSQHQHGVSGNINIVGGGYSAVRQSNVQVSHNGDNNIDLVQTTASPVSVSTYSSVPTIISSPVSVSTYSPIPTVTAVPVPTLSTPTSFEHYDGGVIANIPQLQYHDRTAGSTNISSGLVSSTPYSISLGNRQYSNGATSYNYQSQLSHGSESSEVQGFSSNIKSEVDATQSRGYIYNKPSIPFEETPKVNRVPIITHTHIPSTTVRPIHYVQPEVSIHTVTSSASSDSGFRGYNYEIPSLAFEENPLPKVTTPSVQPQVIVSSTASPVQPISHTYSHTVQTSGYQYPKQSVTFIERPSRPVIISRFSIKKPDVQRAYVSPIQPVIQSTIRPVVFNYQQPIQKTSYTFKDVIQPVSTYSPVTEKQIAVQPVISSYYYKKPAVSSYTFKDIISQTSARPVQQTYSYSTTPQPVVVSSIRPAFVNQHVLVDSPASTYLPVTERPALVSSYNYITPTTARPAVYTYTSPTPYVPQVVSTTSSPQLSIERQNNVEFRGYEYAKPTVSFEEEPTRSVVTHEIRQPVEEVPFVKSTAYVTGNIRAVNPVVVENYQAANYEKVKSNLFGQSADTSSKTYYNNYGTVSSTPAPIQQVYIQSTPRPTYISTVASVVAAKSQSGEQESNFHYYDSRYSSAPQTATEGYLYPKPTVAFEEEPAVPTREYLPSTTSRPIVRYSFSSLDDVSKANVISTESREYSPVRARVRVTTPLPTYEAPVSIESSTLARGYLPARSRVRVTTPEPTYAAPVPSRKYLPGRSRIGSTTASPSREYLPVDSTIRVTTDGAISENLEVRSRRPVKLVKVVRPRTKTIIKQNDMHPILSAKLGAQCTCISNLKKNQRIVVVEDDDDDDGYVVSNDDQSGTVIENYQYEPQQIVDITPTPEIHVQSTTNGIIVPSPTYARRRVRVRPSTTVAYEAIEEEDDSPSDREIAKAVRTGLKLVKQAAKEGAKEGAEEVISNYSPRTGNSREGIECQRAGLFRHPGQCNKFYSCKWDCNKNRYTLHVFNCPVHLTFDNNLGACNWPSQGPACTDDTLLPNE